MWAFCTYIKPYFAHIKSSSPFPLSSFQQMTEDDSLDLQIVDVEAHQVKGSVGGGNAWIQKLRSNCMKIHSENAYEVVPLRSLDSEASFLVRLWCRSARGESVCVVVCDPLRNVYRRLRGPGPYQRLVSAVGEVLHARTCGSARCELVYRATTEGWHCDPSDSKKAWKMPWLKISVASSWQLDRVTSKKKDWLDEAVKPLDGAVSHFFDVQTAHRYLDVRTEVMEATGIKAGGWFRLNPALAGALQKEVMGISCSAVIQVRVSDLARSAIEKVSLAPLRVLSFDIECISEEDGFPSASQKEDTVICIGMYLKTLGDPPASADCTMLCLKDVDREQFDADPELESTKVESFESESALLQGFCRVLRESDADVVVGYNTCLFDWKYIHERVELVMQTSRDRQRAQAYSRHIGVPTTPAFNDLNTSAVGDNPLFYPRMPGRVNFDLWFHLKRENISGLENLKLNTVSKYFLNDEKHDLEAKMMFRAYREGPKGRGKVAAYCRKDCKLVMDLLEKVEALPSIWEMAKIACTAPEDIIFRGQTIKVYTQMVMMANQSEWVVEDLRDGPKEDKEDDEGYQGATVVEPVPGYYLDPVFCLDFASLYPSLMRTNNLSPDCLVKETACNLSKTTPCNVIEVREGVSHSFVKGSVHVGLLPRILEQLLSERKRVKKLMETEEDSKKKALLNSKQLALKISANSVYGACGATKGRLSCKECAEATTAAGRGAIDFTCRFVERKPGFSIVYGDTDSAFMRIPEMMRGETPQELFRRGEELAAEVTQAIADMMPGEVNYIKLEFEKILHPLILYKKKRYAGLCVEDPDKPPKVMAKGLELVRKDACQIVKVAQKGIIEALLKAKDIEAAKEIMAKALEEVINVQHGGPFACIKQSKSLRSSYKDETSQVHCVVRDLMKKRENGSEPRVGDRVEYVVVASKSARVVDKAECVEYAEKEGLPPDWLHYLEAVERALFGIMEVPLMASDPLSLGDMRRMCEQLKSRAQAMVSQHCMARSGARWFPGHVCKDGTVQAPLLSRSLAVPSPKSIVRTKCSSEYSQALAAEPAKKPRKEIVQKPLSSFFAAKQAPS